MYPAPILSTFTDICSLFIHIMPCVTLHCLVHLLPDATQQEKYPAIYNIRHSDPTSPHHYSLPQMMLWATLPYAVWQLSYHFLITVRRREAIKAGRPTSFTWLRKSYAKTWIGKIVLSLPDFLQEFAFMVIQYLYAVLTMLPCPVWFWYRWPSGLFLMTVFIWSVYNGATFYIDVFGNLLPVAALPLLRRTREVSRSSLVISLLSKAAPVSSLLMGRRARESSSRSAASSRFVSLVLNL
jgi:hypothetical protein